MSATHGWVFAVELGVQGLEREVARSMAWSRLVIV